MAKRLAPDGKRLRTLRDETGLSQEELAVKLKLGSATIRRAEKGDSGARLDTIGKLAAFYKVRPEKLTRWV